MSDFLLFLPQHASIVASAASYSFTVTSSSRERPVHLCLQHVGRDKERRAVHQQHLRRKKTTDKLSEQVEFTCLPVLWLAPSTHITNCRRKALQSMLLRLFCCHYIAWIKKTFIPLRFSENFCRYGRKLLTKNIRINAKLQSFVILSIWKSYAVFDCGRSAVAVNFRPTKTYISLHHSKKRNNRKNRVDFNAYSGRYVYTAMH